MTCFICRERINPAKSIHERVIVEETILKENGKIGRYHDRHRGCYEKS